LPDILPDLCPAPANEVYRVAGAESFRKEKPGTRNGAGLLGKYL